jgi:demethylmenaquinone methyltransferase/2-methoxy-6-polyprenyl-1,4-benzoquinol methylase
MRAYYDRRAPEYDDWWLGTGLFAGRDRAGWDAEVQALVALVESLPACRVLDVACGTGFLTRHLRGEVTALDQSPRMLEIAAERMPAATIVCAEAAPLPFAGGSFDRVFTSHFYGHLLPGEREGFLAEARRAGAELVIVDAARGPDEPSELWQERVLNDGSVHRVYKRYFTPDELAAEMEGTALHSGGWFVVAQSG